MLFNLNVKNIFFLFILLIIQFHSNGQFISLGVDAIKSFDDTEPVRTVIDSSTSYVEIEYHFHGVYSAHKEHENENYQVLNIKGFGHLNIPGKPLIPSRNDLILLPDNGTTTVKITEANFEEFDNYMLFPGYKPLTDAKNEKIFFEKDSAFYEQNIFYPEKNVELIAYNQIRSSKIARIRVNPVQFNPATRKIRIYKTIKYRIEFDSEIFSNIVNYKKKNHIKFLKNLVLNANHIPKANRIKAVNPYYDYLIVTVQAYTQAADSLSWWKNQLGYTTKIITAQNWTSQQVKDSIAYYYNNFLPKPEYLAILGDHEDVPAEIINTSSNFISDLYYVCMNGAGDFHPDMAKGRISVSNSQEALQTVLKIINYERHPCLDISFYNKAMNCAQFQDDEPDGYANRRFTHTSEEVRDYLLSKLYSVNRVYHTSLSVDPQYYNDGYYSDGQAIPSNLLRSNGFAWDGDYIDITSSINEGRFIILHRDHGYTQGWGSPDFSTSHFSYLNNEGKYPVIFSINCSSGNFFENICFSEKLIRLNAKGAVGVIGASSTSLSGYNDALAIGFYDAIWSNPGLAPDFGTAGNPNPLPTPHSDIHTMGDVLNHGLIRMSETFGDLEYEYQLFHYFGDPAMEIRNAYPDLISAVSIDSLQCGDTAITISSSNCMDCLATLCVNGILIGETTLSGGTGTISLPPISNTAAQAILTVAQTNKTPYIKHIPIINCTNPPIAQFISTNNNFTVCSNAIQFLDQSSYVPVSWKWAVTPGTHIFENNTTDTSQNPWIRFLQPGSYSVKLIAYNQYGSDSILQSNYINVIPSLSTPVTEDIEAYSAGTQTMQIDGWLFESNAAYKWEVHNDSTPSSITGPIIDHTLGTSTGYYLYTEASGANFYDTASVIMPCMELSGISIPVLSFWYHMFGSDIYKLIIDVKANGNWYNDLYTITGEQQLTYTDPWKQAVVDLTTFAGDHINVRFRAIRGDGYAGDIAIDDINIESVTTKPDVKFGTNDIYSCIGFDVQFTDSTCCGVNNRLWKFTGGNPATSTTSNPVVHYSSPGTYDVKLVVSNIYGSDSLTKTALINIGTNQNAPVSENFESFTVGTPGVFVNGWESFKTDNFEWYVDNGGTPSSNTGPSIDHTLGNISGKYVYTESSYVTPYEEAYLYSPCLSIDPSLQNLTLSFWYHMYGQYIDTLYVDINNGQGWQNIYYLAGSQQMNQTDPWLQAFVDVSAYSGSDIRFRFRSIRGISFMEDVAIDDVQIDTIAYFAYQFIEDTLDFDTTNVFISKLGSFYLKNTGSITIEVDTMFTNAPFSLLSNTNLQIIPGDSSQIYLEFLPITTGFFTDNLHIQTQNGTILYTLEGVSVNSTGISPEHGTGIHIFPNPAKNKFYVRTDQNYNISVCDLHGHTIAEHNNVNRMTIDCNDLSKGVYIIKLNSEKQSFSRRIVIL